MRATICSIAGLSLLLVGGAFAAPQDAEQPEKITYAPVFADALASSLRLSSGPDNFRQFRTPTLGNTGQVGQLLLQIVE